MDVKQRVLAGMAVTALLTALLLAGALPALWLAFLVLSLGLLLTYYHTLSWKRGQTMGRQQLLLRYAAELYRPTDTPAVESLFQKWSLRLLDGSESEKEVMTDLTSYARQRLDAEKAREQYLHHLIDSLVDAVESADPRFKGHHKRVARISGLLGAKLALDPQEQKDLYYAALLHDMGRIAAGLAGEDDPEAVKQHALLGAKMLPEHPEFMAIKQGIMYHHERYNGTGYPEGLKANEIPLMARIIAVADVYDALTRLGEPEERLPHAQAVQKIRRASGSGLDPLVIVALEEIEPLLTEEPL